MHRFFHKLRVELDNSLSVNGLKQVPSADEDNSAAYVGF